MMSGTDPTIYFLASLVGENGIETPFGFNALRLDAKEGLTEQRFGNAVPWQGQGLVVLSGSGAFHAGVSIFHAAINEFAGYSDVPHSHRAAIKLGFTQVSPHREERDAGQGLIEIGDRRLTAEEWIASRCSARQLGSRSPSKASNSWSCPIAKYSRSRQRCVARHLSPPSRARRFGRNRSERVADRRWSDAYIASGQSGAHSADRRSRRACCSIVCVGRVG